MHKPVTYFVIDSTTKVRIGLFCVSFRGKTIPFLHHLSSRYLTKGISLTLIAALKARGPFAIDLTLFVLLHLCSGNSEIRLMLQQIVLTERKQFFRSRCRNTHFLTLARCCICLSLAGFKYLMNLVNTERYCLVTINKSV